MKTLLMAGATALALLGGAQSAFAATGGTPPPAVPGLTSAFGSGVTTYSNASSFNAAVTNPVVDNFQGVATGSNGQDYVSYGSNASGGLGTYTDANGTTFSAYNSGYNSNLAIEGTQYGTNANGSYGAIGNDFGSDVLSTNYSPLTIKFAAPVNAFSINFAALGRAFSATSGPDTFSFTIPGLGSATEGTSGGINAGAMGSFFGLTSATAFDSIVIDASTMNGFGVNNRFFDNVTFQAAPAVSAAPEPGTWALMFIGVGMAGLALRRRQMGAIFAV